MAAPVLSLRGVSLNLGDKMLFAGVDLSVEARDRICLVGRNGSGKSTLLRMAAGLLEPDNGERFVQPGRRVAYMSQEPDLGGATSVADYVAEGLPAVERHHDHRIAAILDAVNLDGASPTASLSGGEMRRAAIARAMVSDPDVLLLDEPTNHLDIAAIQWLEEILARHRGAVVMISHDRAFLTALTRTTLWLDRGRLRRLDKGFAHFEPWAENIFDQEEAERHRLEKLIATETVWSHQGITARRRRNQGRLRRLQEMRAERARRIATPGQIKLSAETGGGSGRLVIEAENIGKRFGDTTVISNFSTRVMRGDRIGIIGPNGAGKTTLLKMLTGELAPDSGSVRHGTGLKMVYLDQRRAKLDPAKTVWETLCESGGDQVLVQGQPRHVVGYLKDFNFADSQARSPVGSLSGGERNRLLLAKYLAAPSNFLVLDEPTNDLDMDTLDLLQELLADYQGTLLLVSHDRDFLDRVVTSVIALEGDGRITEYAGGYTDYVRQSGRAKAGPADGPRETLAARPEAAATRSSARAPKKLSYKEQRALDLLPGRMADLEREIATLEAALADAALFARDPQDFSQRATRLRAARLELAQFEEEWLELEMKREALQGKSGG